MDGRYVTCDFAFTLPPVPPSLDNVAAHPSGNKQSGWHSGLLQFFLDFAGLRALIYSGDHDLCVPHTGSEAWTSAMHRSDSEDCKVSADADDDNQLAKCDGVINPWQPWYNSDSPKQVGYGQKLAL